MELTDKPDDFILEQHAKILKHFPKNQDILSLFFTLLGVADNVSQHVLQEEQGNYNNMNFKLKYSLVQIYQILTVISKIVRDEVKVGELKVDGHFPSGDDAWKSETDFEKRFILMIKLFHKHLKEEGKL